MDPTSDITTLLRKCVVIATKLKLDEFLTWANYELKGYPPDTHVPDYRKVSAELKGYNPYNGMWLPFLFEAEPPDYARYREVYSPVAGLQDLIRDRDGHLEMALPNELARHLMESSGAPRPPTSIIHKTSVFALLEAVRNVIIDWSLKLESAGILGEGMTFTQKEKQTAMSNTYNIHNFNGVLGDVTANSVEIKGYDDIHKILKASGVSQVERNDLEKLMDEIPKSSGQAKRALLIRATAWVVKNAENLKSLSDGIHSWINQQNAQ